VSRGAGEQSVRGGSGGSEEICVGVGADLFMRRDEGWYLRGRQ
jgi:hypothetical protein